MNRSLIPALILGALAMPGTAVGKVPEQSDPLALEALSNFAQCAVKRSPDGAAQLLDQPFDSSDYKAKLRKFAKGHDYCAPGSRLGFSGLPFAGDLAEALIKQRFGSASLAVAAAGAVPADQNPMESIGICVLRLRPDAVKDLLSSVPASAEELDALQRTGDILQSCIPKRMTMQLNKPAVRAIYALGAYRQLVGPFAPPAKQEG